MLKPDNSPLFLQAQEYAFSYMDTINDRSTFPTDESICQQWLVELFGLPGEPVASFIQARTDYRSKNI